jgi:hypothetical protein
MRFKGARFDEEGLEIGLGIAPGAPKLEIASC